jgi:hypothetical protein
MRVVWRAALCMVLGGLAAPAVAATYYVDAVQGSDRADGLSAAKAWQTLERVNAAKFGPGDQVLLRAGETFAGKLTPHGSGTKEAPILLSAYGEGAKPVVAGGGADEALMLDDVSFWTVRGITVTNHGKVAAVRNGIEVHVAYAGLVQGIHLERVDVMDVNGDVHSKSSGGVGILGWGKNGVAPRFDDIAIVGCTVAHVDGQGLWVHMKGKGDSAAGSTNESTNDSPTESGDDSGQSGEYGITRLRIAESRFEDTGRNAIFLRDSVGAVIEDNTVLYASARTHGNAVVVAWAKGTIVRGNEVGYTGKGQGEGENGGFDADDGAVGTVFERNWTHDNAGGSVNVVVDPGKHVPNDGTVIRYNLSESDGARVFGVGGPATNVVIANNTVIVLRGASTRVLALGRFTAKKPGDPTGVAFVNNLVDAEGKASYVLEAARVSVVANCFFGKHAMDGVKDPEKSTDDPGFSLPPAPATSWKDLERFRPAKGSTCAGPGRPLGRGPALDLLGTAIPAGAPGRGALVGR